MSDIQPTHGADPSNEGGNHGGDGAAASSSAAPATPEEQAAALKEINRITGRTFTNIEDAQKHYSNLNSIVGNPRLREDATMMDSFVKKYAKEQGITPDEARTQIEATLKGQSASADKPDAASIPPAVVARMERLERSEFLTKFPNAAEHIDKVAKYAKANGLELESAFTELYGDMFKKMEEEKRTEAHRSAKMEAQVSASASIPEAPAGSQEAKALENYSKTGRREYLTEAIKLRTARLARSN